MKRRCRDETLLTKKKWIEMGYSGQNVHAMCHTTPCVLPAIRPIYPTNRAIFDEMPRLEKVTSICPTLLQTTLPPFLAIRLGAHVFWHGRRIRGVPARCCNADGTLFTMRNNFYKKPFTLLFVSLFVPKCQVKVQLTRTPFHGLPPVTSLCVVFLCVHGHSC